MADGPRDDELLQEGRDALARADWPHARAWFAAARERSETAEALEGLSEAAHFQGDYAEAIDLKELAFTAYRRRGEREAAARVARWLAFLHGAVQGNRAVANGWMARAVRLLEGLPESVEHGHLALDRVAWTADVDEREGFARTALDIGRRAGDAGLEFSAQAVLGHAAVVRGNVDDGMALIDEALAAVSAGEVEAVDAVAQIYCRLLGACERATDVRRAEQWLGAASGFAEWGAFVGPTCRLHYGAILVAIGRWPEAEEQLLAASRTFEHGYRGMRPAALVRLAALRVRQGRLEDAELLLAGIEAHAAAREQRAAIALARGDLPLAADLARLCLDADDGSTPASAALWELLVRVHVARGELEEADRALGRLQAIATACGDERVAATADLAAGRVRAAHGDPQARGLLQRAVDGYASLELPLHAAQAQLELARAMAPTASDGAVAEARVALAAFRRIGADRDADAAAELLRSLGVRAARTSLQGADGLTRREAEVLELLATGLSNPEIARRLYLSRKTVQHHVAHILAKLGVSTRAEAAAYAARRAAGASEDAATR